MPADEITKPTRKPRLKPTPLLPTSLGDNNLQIEIEIGVDEVGRGPMFGRVYAAAVILPKEGFDHSKMKDSKKFHSEKKREEVAKYIQEHAIGWAVAYEDEKVIDEMNVLQATQKAMHTCISTLVKSCSLNPVNTKLLIDGNYFNSFKTYHADRGKWDIWNHECVEGGDNKYSCIAAASILAKTARDDYIDELCKEHPELIERYSLDTNKGYGSKKHLEGIQQYGITPWHRRTFGICKGFA